MRSSRTRIPTMPCSWKHSAVLHSLLTCVYVAVRGAPMIFAVFTHFLSSYEKGPRKCTPVHQPTNTWKNMIAREPSMDYTVRRSASLAHSIKQWRLLSLSLALSLSRSLCLSLSLARSFSRSLALSVCLSLSLALSRALSLSPWQVFWRCA